MGWTRGRGRRGCGDTCLLQLLLLLARLNFEGCSCHLLVPEDGGHRCSEVRRMACLWNVSALVCMQSEEGQVRGGPHSM